MSLRRKTLALHALTIACTPIVASAATLFTEDFNAGTPGDRFQDPVILDRAGTQDVRATYNFDYGAYKYWHISADGQNQDVGEFIPQAPRTVNPLTAPKIGLLLDANNNADSSTPNTAQIDIYPKLSSYAGGVAPSGDYKLTFDLFMNYNGRLLGGGGSTEFMKAGINQAGGGIGGLVLTGDPGLAGQSIAVSGEGQNGQDYRMYQANTRYDELDVRAGYAALDEGVGAPGPAGADNTYYQNLFTFTNPSNASEAWYENTGAPGKHWTTVEIRYEDGIVYTSMKPAGAADFTLISARTDTSASSGHIMFGYADTFNGIADIEVGDGTASDDANFALFDNVVVETVAQARQKWAVAGTANWSNTNAWQNGDVADGVGEVADFTTQLPAAQIVFVDSARTVRSITFDSAAAGYTLSGTNTITLDTMTSGIRGSVKAVSGSHVIAAPLRLAKPTTFDIAAGAHVKVNDLVVDIALPTVPFEPNPYVADPNPLIKRGAGVAEVNVLRNLSAVTITDGTLKVTPNGSASGVSVVPALNISGTGKLDLSDNKLVTRAGVGSFSGGAYSDVSGLIAAGRGSAGGNAQWNGATGITTSDTRAIDSSNRTSLGVIDASDKFRQVGGDPIGEADTALFAGQTVTGADTLVMFTWGGDANLDGKINIDDYGRIDSNVGTPGANGWANGDFNYDGKINIDDYGIIDSNISQQGGVVFPTGSDATAGGVAAVPEPASLSLLVIGASALLGRRRRGGR